MTPYHAVPPATDCFPSALKQLLITARAEIDRHLNDNGFCAVCGVRFPCERAQLADLVLGAW
jgi:hypothetical protein